MELSPPHLGNSPEVTRESGSTEGHRQVTLVGEWGGVSERGVNPEATESSGPMAPSCWRRGDRSVPASAAFLGGSAGCSEHRAGAAGHPVPPLLSSRSARSCLVHPEPDCPSSRHQLAATWPPPESQSTHLGEGCEWGRCASCVSEARSSVAGPSLRLWLWLLISEESRKLWPRPQQQYLFI